LISITSPLNYSFISVLLSRWLLKVCYFYNSQDIQEKADKITENRILLLEKGIISRNSREHLTMEGLVDAEFENNLSFLNSDTNKQVLRE
jgi:hypothetical protein